MLWLAILTGGLFLLWRAFSRSPESRKLVWWAIGIVAFFMLILAPRVGLRTPFLLLSPLAVWVVWRALEHASRLNSHRPTSTEPSRAKPMTRVEALRILGLEEGATLEDVRAAHRNLIKKVHPDQGGSSFLTQQVNEAKRILELSSK